MENGKKNKRNVLVSMFASSMAMSGIVEFLLNQI